MQLAAMVILGIIAQPSSDPVLSDGRCDPSGPWKMSMESRAIGPGQPNIVRIPKAEGDWAILRLR
jgi:hypothetical protein